ncbi:MAG: T9SS type A sorting domain-containing protein [bacterium]|nr:T9SS type A sorting domain-containing protein [bacterium]
MKKYLISGIAIVFVLFATFLAKAIISEQMIFSHLNVVPQEKTSQLSNIKNDFLVNNDTSGGCKQSSPTIAISYSGNILVAWEDMRNGNDYDIYACKYTAYGIPLTSIFRVNDDSGGSAQNTPSISADSIGNFVIVWNDTRDGEPNIYGQLYNNQAIPQGNNFIINDDNSGETQDEPAVAFLPDNKFAAVWTDQRNRTTRDRDIYCQIYNLNGTKVGSNFFVNNDGSRVGQRTPHISPDGPNTFSVVWGDSRQNELDIFCQRYTSSGTPINTNFKINDDTTNNFFGWYPFINSNLNNQNVIVWRDNRIKLSDPRIWGQRYQPTKSLVGTNFCVNPTGKCCWHSLTKLTSVGVDSAGNFNIVWTDNRRIQNATDTYIQKYDSNGNPVGNNTLVNNTPSDDPNTELLSSAPMIVTQKHSTQIQSVVVWQDKPDSEDINIMLQTYDNANNPIGNNINIVPEAGTRPQIQPQIAMNENGNFVIVWEDRREWYHCDIFAQRYDKTGNPIGTNIKVNDSTHYDNNAMPAVAIDTNGAFIVVWRESDTFISARKYDANGNPISVPFQVICLTAGFAMASSEPKIAMDVKGNFVVVWEDLRLDNKFPDIFGQKYSADCTPIDTLFKVNEVTGTQSILPNISMKKNGEFIVVWQEEEYLQDKVHFDVEGQRFDSLGQKIGTNFIINDDAAFAVQQYNPSVVLKENGEFIVVWEDYRNGNADIYCQRLDSSALPIGSNFRINQDFDSSLQRFPAITVIPESGNFIVSWTSSKNVNMQIMAQILDSTGNFIDNNFVVNETPFHASNQRWGKSGRNIAANNELIAFTWMDNRRLQGWDIYAKLIGKKSAIEEISQTKIIISPNPVHKKLTVRYIVSKTGNYSISLYDITGRQIIKQSQGKKIKGAYTAEFDVSKYNSGIYFTKVDGDLTPQSNVNKVIIFRDSK